MASTEHGEDAETAVASSSVTTSYQSKMTAYEKVLNRGVRENERNVIIDENRFYFVSLIGISCLSHYNK